MLLAGRITPDRVDDRPGEYDTDYHPSSPLNQGESVEQSQGEAEDESAESHSHAPEPNDDD